MTVFNENLSDSTALTPVTPLQDSVEGHAVEPNSALTYRYDIEGAGVIREAQRIVSVIALPNTSNNLEASGTDTNLAEAMLDVGRKAFYKALKRLRRVHEILGPQTVTPISYQFDGSGQTITNGANNARNLSSGKPIIAFQDFAFCDFGGRTDITGITGVSISDTGAVLATVNPLEPAIWGGSTYIMRPSVGTFPTIREDRTHYTERVTTGWLPKATFTDSPYVLGDRPVAYPIPWTFDGNSETLFKGTFRVRGATSSEGANPAEITTSVLGTTPTFPGYAFPEFPSPTGALQFTNDPGATLDLSGVSGLGGYTYIKVDYCHQIADESSPDVNSISPTQTTCKHNLRMPSNSSIAGYSGTGDILDLYKNGFFCTKWADLNKAEWEAYEGSCNNSSCREYETWETGYVPTPEALDDFWWGKGEYSIRDLGGPGTTFGRDGKAGLMTMVGFPVYDATGWWLLDKEWLAHGVFRYNVNIEDPATGFVPFLSWDDAVADAGDFPDDTDTGLFATFAQHTSKKDPAGGILSNGAVLDARSLHLAGYNFEALIGYRRTGVVGMDFDGEHSGPGFVEVQRARACRYTSPTFADDEPISMITDGLTEIEFFSAKMADSFTYEGTFRFPKWMQRVQDGHGDDPDKDQTNTIFTSAISSNSLVLYMDLQTCNQAIPDGPTSPPINVPYKSGGQFALGENVHQDTGPFSSFPFGDRNFRCTVGDVITITHDGTDYKVTVTGTKIFGNSDTEDTSQTAPNDSVQGITQTIIDYHQRCDMVICELDDEVNSELIALHGSLTNFAGLTVSSVKMEAVIPAKIYMDGAEGETGYEPVISVVNLIPGAHEKTDWVEGTDYILDRTLGEIHFKRNSLPASNTLRLHYKGHVFHTKPTLYAEDISQCNTGLDSLLEGFLSLGSTTAGTFQAGFQVWDENTETAFGAYMDAGGAYVVRPNKYDWLAEEDPPDVIINDNVPYTDIRYAASPASGSYGVGTSSIQDPNDLFGGPAPTPPDGPSPGDTETISFALSFPLTEIPVMPRAHPDEIKKAYVNIVIRDGVMKHQWSHVNRTEEPPLHDAGEELVDEDIGIRILGAWYKVNEGVVEITEADEILSSLSVVGTLTKFDIGGGQHEMRGTLDVTACVQALCGGRQKGFVDGKKPCLIPFPAAANVDIFKVTEDELYAVILSCAPEWGASGYGENSYPEVGDFEAYSMTFSGLTLSNLHVQLDKEELIISDYTDAAHTPDLTFVKPTV